MHRPLFTDIDEDGRYEIICLYLVNSGVAMIIVDDGGQALDMQPLPSDAHGRFRIADYDGDGRAEIIVNKQDHGYVLDRRDGGFARHPEHRF